MEPIRLTADEVIAAVRAAGGDGWDGIEWPRAFLGREDEMPPTDLLALARARADERRRIVALLLGMAEDADRFAASAMARLDDIARGHAYREAARRVGELG